MGEQYNDNIWKNDLEAILFEVHSAGGEECGKCVRDASGEWVSCPVITDARDRIMQLRDGVPDDGGLDEGDKFFLAPEIWRRENW